MSSVADQMAAQARAMAHRADRQAMQMAAAARHNAAMARQQAARAAAMGRRHAHAVAYAQAQKSQAAARAIQTEIARKRRALRDALAQATARTLDATPITHANGAVSLLLERNWVYSDGSDHVVLRCNTKLPGSGRPAALFLLTDLGITWIDLVSKGLAEITRRGRVFLYAANSIWSEGEAYAVLPAAFEGEHGAVGHWSFATVGAIKGSPFIVNDAAIGTFVDRQQRDLVVARPLNYSISAAQWIWYGRSSTSVGTDLVIHGTMPTDASETVLSFRLPPSGKPDIAALRCTKRDDRGDPIALFDAQADSRHIIRAVGNTLYLLCPANRRLPSGEPIFIAPTKPAEDGTMVFSGSGLYKGQNVAFELETNHQANGRPIFLARAGTTYGTQKVAAIALRQLTP